VDDLTIRWRPGSCGESDERDSTGTWITIGDPGDAAAHDERTVTVLFYGELNDPWAEELCSRPFSPTFPDQRSPGRSVRLPSPSERAHDA